MVKMLGAVLCGLVFLTGCVIQIPSSHPDAETESGYSPIEDDPVIAAQEARLLETCNEAAAVFNRLENATSQDAMITEYEALERVFLKNPDTLLVAKSTEEAVEMMRMFRDVQVWDAQAEAAKEVFHLGFDKYLENIWDLCSWN